MAASDSTPLPIKNQALQVTFGLWLTTGLVNTGAAGLDSEVSKDGGSFTDCTNEATEIGSSGTYTLDLTNTELNADVVAIQVKSSTTNAITYKLTIYPSSGSKMQVNATQVGSQTASAAGTVTFPGTIASATNITAGTITTVTNLTNAPTSGDLTATMKTSVTTAATASTPTIAATQAFSNTGTWTGNLSGSVGSVTSGVTVTTNNDKTGYSLTQAFPSNFSSLAITGGGAVTSGTVSDKTGYSLANGSFVTATFGTCDFTSTMKTSLNAATPSVTVSDKTGFSLVSGSIATATFAAGATLPRVTLCDTTTTNTDMRGTNNAALAATALSTAVWTAPPTGFLAATFPGTVSSYAGGAVASVTAAVTITGDAATAGTRFLTMIALDGSVYQYTANALELGPGGGSGLTAQQTRDAMKLAPTAGSPAAGSIDAELDAIPRAGAGPFIHTNTVSAETATVAITT